MITTFSSTNSLIVVFNCEQCQETQSLQELPELTVLRVDCSLQVNPLQILKLLQVGTQAVFLSCYQPNCSSRGKTMWPYLLKSYLPFLGFEESQLQLGENTLQTYLQDQLAAKQGSRGD